MLAEPEVQETKDNKTGPWHNFMTPISESSLSGLLWNDLTSHFAGKRRCLFPGVVNSFHFTAEAPGFISLRIGRLL